jgi:hypothetical protein
MTLILSLHPAGQLMAILFACYAAYLGYQRTKSLHFGKAARFLRQRHGIIGAIALISMLGGIVAGKIIVNTYLLEPDMTLHVVFAMAILVLGLFGISSGFFLYFKPKPRRILPAVHGINNLILLIISFAQIVTGVIAYLRYVLRW